MRERAQLTRRDFREPFLLGALAGPAWGVIFGYEWWVVLLLALVGGPFGILVAARNDAIREAFGHRGRWFSTKDNDPKQSKSSRAQIRLTTLALVTGVLAAGAAAASGGGVAIKGAAFAFGACLVAVVWVAVIRRDSPATNLNETSEPDDRPPDD